MGMNHAAYDYGIRSPAVKLECEAATRRISAEQFAFDVLGKAVQRDDLMGAANR